MTSPAVRYDRGSPFITIRNETEHVSDRELVPVVRALQRQIDEHFFPLWGWRARLFLDRAPRRARAMEILLAGTPPSEDRGEVGYHFIDGLPHTTVYTRDDGGNPIEFHSTLSHEALEMIADPGVNLYAQGYYVGARGKHVAAWIPCEVCDPVQECEYRVDGFWMSDFVVPEWFEPERRKGSMPFSFRKSVDGPFRIAPGGYVSAVVGRSVRTVWGPEAVRKRRRHRLLARRLPRRG